MNNKPLQNDKGKESHAKKELLKGFLPFVEFFHLQVLLFDLWSVKAQKDLFQDIILIE